MSEERLDRIERHIEQLIQMVAENNKVSKDLLSRTDRMDTRMEGIETEFAEEKRLNRQRHAESQQLHKELLKESRSQNVDIGYLRDKVAEHDMEINRIKEAVN
ncbi:hypothetical protein HUG15_15805 [Salicibibacter cibarius]|uniref:Uncharacterized protein n=1 Tax=Salicibibacter cibarius TaxID=2743000 RepID=A0A7T6Z5R5_9BACI|nr:hypothetical protein [Salicibibacter cibarius]QQK76886.1 hypothetical protein HUG15_15805 [Salicibibacter cibarius]